MHRSPHAPTRAERWALGVIRRRWAVVAATLSLVALAAFGVKNLYFATNYRVFFGKNNPDLAAFEAVQNIYAKNDSILFVLAPESGQVFTRDSLAAVQALTEGAWQIPASTRVDSITNFQHTYAEQDDLVVENLVPAADRLSAADIARIREIALGRPELRNRLISADARVTGVNVTLELSGDDPGELYEPVRHARELAAEIEQAYPGMEVRLTGLTMLNNAFMESGMADMTTLIPLMFLVLVVVMALLLRSLTGTLATTLVIGLSTASAMGLAGWAGVPLEPVSALAPTMILTMAIADSIHILVSAQGEMRAGRGKREALVESLRINMSPVFVTSLTTTIGFLSMNFSDAPPFQRLGTITAAGVAAAFVLSVTFLPALMAILPFKARSRRFSRRTDAFDRLGVLVVAKRRPLLWASVAAVLLIVPFLPTNTIADEYVKYFDTSLEFRRDSDFTLENLTGIYQLQFSLDSGEPGGISEPSFLATLDQFAGWLRAQPEIVHVSSLSDTMRRLNMNLHGDDPAAFRLPEDRELAAQYLLLYEMSLPYGLDLNNQINVDKSSTRLIATAGDVSTAEYLELAARAEGWLEDHAPPSMQAGATGPSILFSHITERNVRAMVTGTAFAFLLISGVLMLTLRDVKIGLLSLIPNLVPAAMAFGAWGLLVGQVGFAVSVVGAMTMGIVVDDSVHFLSKYLRARREQGLDAAGAVRYAFASVGRALWVTSAVLVAGFLILAQSTFKQNSDMGLLAAVTIVFALGADFFLLPALLLLERRKAPAEETVAEPIAPVAEAA